MLLTAEGAVEFSTWSGALRGACRSGAWSALLTERTLRRTVVLMVNGSCYDVLLRLQPSTAVDGSPLRNLGDAPGLRQAAIRRQPVRVLRSFCRVLLRGVCGAVRAAPRGWDYEAFRGRRPLALFLRCLKSLSNYCTSSPAAYISRAATHRVTFSYYSSVAALLRLVVEVAPAELRRACKHVQPSWRRPPNHHRRAARHVLRLS